MKLQQYLCALFCMLLSMALGSCVFFKEYRSFSLNSTRMLFSVDYGSNIDDKINLNGVYLSYNDSTQEFVSKVAWRGFSTDGMYFQPDGTVCKITYYHPYPKVFEIKRIDDNFSINSGGIYRIAGDSLYQEIYYRSYERYPWELSLLKSTYKIIDSHTLKQSKQYAVNSDTVSLTWSAGPRYHHVYKFVPFTEEANRIDAKIKKKKWMWENKEDWKAYKRELKAFKKEQKKARKEQKKQSQGLPHRRYE